MRYRRGATVVQLCITINPTTIERVDEFAKNDDRSRSSAIDKLLNTQLDAIEKRKK